MSPLYAAGARTSQGTGEKCNHWTTQGTSFRSERSMSRMATIERHGRFRVKGLGPACEMEQEVDERRV